MQLPFKHSRRLLPGVVFAVLWVPARAAPDGLPSHQTFSLETETAAVSASGNAAAPRKLDLAPENSLDAFTFSINNDSRRTDFTARYGIRFSGKDVKKALPAFLGVITNPQETLTAILKPLSLSGIGKTTRAIGSRTDVNIRGVQFKPYKVWVSIDYYYFQDVDRSSSPESGPDHAAVDAARFRSLGAASQIKVLFEPVVSDVRDNFVRSLPRQAFENTLGTANPDYKNASAGDKGTILNHIRKIGNMWEIE
ncbi:MAG: hypothetical protein WCS77_08825 [Elusimicrobiaceae bacterium]